MIRVHVRNERVNRSFNHASGALEFGRTPSRGPNARFVLFDPAASKCHLRITELPGGRVLIENTSQRSPVFRAAGGEISPGEVVEADLPLQLTVGQTLIELIGSAPSEPVVPLANIGYETIAAPLRLSQHAELHHSLMALREDLSPERLLRWLEMLVGVQRAAAGSPEFYRQTVEALVQLVAMDQALILLRAGDAWSVASEYRSRPASDGDGVAIVYSRTIVESVREGKRTLYRNSAVDQMGHSLADVEAVVASPILSVDGSVVGVLYASRDLSSTTAGQVGPLEAQVVQLLAATVATGLARMEQEASALRSRVQFEQFFSRELAEELRRNPAILEGEERDVTVLFADIRGFSRLAQRVGPRDYYRVAQEILSRLTQRVQDEHGIIVDYTGDGLLAMWNAPFHHLDHASRACRTALAMVTDLDQLVESWKGLPAESLDIGVGVNTGTALVGNTGTPLKMKYGPRGHVVNLGSRLEGATKHLGVRVIISASTRQTIDPSITVRRLGKARLVGIADPVELYELVDANLTEESRRRLTRYETALALFEVGDFGAASLALQEILRESAGDIDLPTFQLLSRVIPLQKNAPADFDSVLRLDTK